jgi:hypothetical protein
VSGEIISLPHLRTLIGLRVRYQGEACRVVEVLESPSALVLEVLRPGTVQADLHGRPGEYGQEHRIVPVLSEDCRTLHDALLELDLLD